MISDDKEWKKEQYRRDHPKDRWSEQDSQAQEILYPPKISKMRTKFDDRRTNMISDQLWEENRRLGLTFDRVQKTSEALYKDDPRNGRPDTYRA
jgi:hypothetical protein